MIIKFIAKDTHTLTKIVDTEDYPNTDFDTLIEVEDNQIRKAYGKKYNETCGTVIVEEVSDDIN